MTSTKMPAILGCCFELTRLQSRYRTMLTSEPPIYIVAPGRVFRRDTPDATHMPVFHQIEGLVVDRDISMADLAGTIEAFTQAFFGEGFTSRFGRHTSRSLSLRLSLIFVAQMVPGLNSGVVEWFTPRCFALVGLTLKSGVASRSVLVSTAWQ